MVVLRFQQIEWNSKQTRPSDLTGKNINRLRVIIDVMQE
jgi:hypothetical protein